MPAINMGNLNAALYGLARGEQDADRIDRENEAASTDQAIRRERLDAEKEARPLRKRVLEQQSEAEKLGIDTAKLKKADAEQAHKDATEATRLHNILLKHTRDFQLSGGDPSHIIDAFKEIDPEKGKDMKGERGEDGSITLTGADGHPITFRGQTKSPDGKQMTADDEVLHFIANYMDPVKAFQQKYGYAQQVGLEKEKTDRAVSVAGIRADATDRSARNRSSDAWTNRQLNQIKPALDSMLKTTGVAGSFIAGYSHADDAELRGIMEEGVEAEVMQGTPVRAAARKVVDDVRATYDKASSLAKERASALRKSKIDPRDQKAVAKAAAEGNADAKAFLQLQKATEEALGPSVAKYLLGNLPAK